VSALLVLVPSAPQVAVAQAATFPTAASPSAADGDFAGRVNIGGGRKLYLACRGTGSPTVILEAGYPNDADIWSVAVSHPPAVLPGVAAFTRVCAYDRPGTFLDASHRSRSDPVPMPRTARDIVADLHALLRAAHVPGPYVLVGHSLGGLLVRLYASTYPRQVVGLVLVDATSEKLKALLGPVRWAAILRFANQPPPGLAHYRERETVNLDASIAQMQAAKPLRRLPLVVLSAGRFDIPPTLLGGLSAAAYERILRESQNYLARLEPGTPHIIARASGHYIQLQQPELVIRAVRQVVQKVR
jgi:pimeloyl-ACP methyl ester carboxylesterase